MIRRMFSRRSFFGLLGSAPLAVPALVRAAAEPAMAGAEVQIYPAAVAASHRTWQSFVAQIRAREAGAVALRFDQVMSLWPPRLRCGHRDQDGERAAPGASS